MSMIDSGPKVPKLLLTPKEAAAALALSERTLWDLTNKKVIRSVKIGRLVRYSPDDLTAFIERRQEDFQAGP